MKKFVGVVLALSLMLLSFGCGDDGSIELTKDNYEEYLSVSAMCEPTDKVVIALSSRDFYESLTAAVAVEGVSSNFNYRDVEVTVRIAGYYAPCKSSGVSQPRVDVDEKAVVKCDVSGSGTDGVKIEITPGYYVTKGLYDVGYEVVDVKGKVEPVK